MVFSRALVCAALLCVAAAGSTKVNNSGNVKAVQKPAQVSVNLAGWTKIDQNALNAGINNAGNGNEQGIAVNQENYGRKLLGWGWNSYYYVDNSGDVWAKQAPVQVSGNVAKGNSGKVSQNSLNAGINNAGNGNTQSIGVNQENKGRKLLGWGSGHYYYVDNSGNVYAKQAPVQVSGNVAKGNSDKVSQNSLNAGINNAGNGNTQGISVNQENKGRKLLGYGSKYVDNSGNVWVQQDPAQISANVAYKNWAPVKQNSLNAGINNAGNGNSQGIAVNQELKGRKLLGWGSGYHYYVDNSGDVWAKQAPTQVSLNVAKGNKDKVSQNSLNAGINNAGNGNSQGIEVNQENKGRKLLGWGGWGKHYYIDNSGDVWAKQAPVQVSGNVAVGNSDTVNQQSLNAGINNAGNGNTQSIYSSQTIKP